MSVAKSAATKIDWATLTSNLRPETVASLSAFRRRHGDLSAQIAELRSQLKPIDFTSYRQSLQNTKVVDEAEKAIKGFVPAKYDVSEQIKLINAQEAKTLALAERTAAKVEVEVKELGELLKNIENARPVDQLTVEDVVAAKPELKGKAMKMLERQQYGLPAYLEKFQHGGIGL
ncbi:ATP synthase d subunit [Gonapodya sp. JEL0774]|nr:ATP synthase d subunit [Gonapodya sp. JEL0774]